MALAPKVKTNHGAIRRIRRQYLAGQKKSEKYVNKFVNLLEKDWPEKLRIIKEQNEKSVNKEENDNKDEIAQDDKNYDCTETTDEITETPQVEDEIISGSIGTAVIQDLETTFETKTESNDAIASNNETATEEIEESLNVCDQPISDNSVLKDIPRVEGYEIMFEDDNNVGDSGDADLKLDNECNDNDANNGPKDISVKDEEKEVDDDPDSGVKGDENIADDGDRGHKSNAEDEVSEDDNEEGENDDYNAEDNCEVNPDDIDLADLSDGDLEDY